MAITNECLTESTKSDIIDIIDKSIACFRLQSNEILRDVAAGRQTVKDHKSALRELNTHICRMELLKKDIKDIHIC